MSSTVAVQRTVTMHGIPVRANRTRNAGLRTRNRQHQELVLASELQTQMLPSCHPPEALVDLGARCVPARLLGGDFYDFFRYEGKAISAEAIGDVSGKGASAAIYASLVTGILRSLAPLELGPAEMLETLNQALLRRPVPGRFVSLIYATWDERQRLFRIANAGLPHPICVRNGETFSLQVEGMPLGLFEEAKYEEQVLECGAGDLVVFYTDGVTDAIDDRNEDFGPERLQGVVRAHAGESAEGVVSGIFVAVAAHTGSMEAFDDQTVVAVRT
jgi:sigma-B regulation protein RsbU (phosphoserine phosphatase)